jgi:glutamyl-tRNA reductase
MSTPNSILAFGINHQTAPVSIRERVAFAPDHMAQALRDLAACQAVNEAAILSTCNRTELYCTLSGSGHNNELLGWFSDYHKLPQDEILPYTYSHTDQQAVRHILRVASGLDSLVLGEPQILGQMKAAYETACRAGTTHKLLSKLFQHTFSVAKHVRTDTAIGSSAISVAFAAVSLARQIFGDLNTQTALLIGAGETIELAARHLHENNLKHMIIANRTLLNAHHLAEQFGGSAITLADIPQHLARADIIISSTASQLPILGKGSVERAIRERKHRPMFMVDIAVPRDIESEVDTLDDVYLYTVDDLREIIEENMHSRRQAAKQAEEIIDNRVEHFMEWLKSLDALETLRAYRENAEHIRDETLDRALHQLAKGDDPEKVLQELAHLLTNKLIHNPSVQMKQASIDGRKDILRLARELFVLDSHPDDN